MFESYFDISGLKGSDESGNELGRIAREAYVAEKKRRREDEALLNSVDFDAAILVWQHQRLRSRLDSPTSGTLVKMLLS